MEDILGFEQDSIWSKGYYDFIMSKQPSLVNALHPYFEFSFDEETNKYEYVFIEPYDD